MREDTHNTRERDDMEADRGDESGTGLDLLEAALEACRASGEEDIYRAIEKSNEDVVPYRKWLLTGECIQYLDIVVKGRDGVQVQGPIAITRFSGTVDPKYSDGV